MFMELPVLKLCPVSRQIFYWRYLVNKIVFRIAIILLPSQRTLTMFLGVWALCYESAATLTNIVRVLWLIQGIINWTKSIIPWLNCYHTRKYVVYKCKLVILTQFDKLCLYLELSVDISFPRKAVLNAPKISVICSIVNNWTQTTRRRVTNQCINLTPNILSTRTVCSDVVVLSVRCLTREEKKRFGDGLQAVMEI